MTDDQAQALILVVSGCRNLLLALGIELGLLLVLVWGQIVRRA